MSQLFESFEREPVGAASIAQAHRATLLDGAKVIFSEVQSDPLSVS